MVFCADELKALQLCDGFVEGVFDAALVDEQTLEDAGFGEIVDGDLAAIGFPSTLLGAGALALITTSIFGEDAVGVDVEAAGTLEPPCQIDDAVGEHFFDVALRVQLFGELGFEGVVGGGVLVGQDGGGGGEAVPDGVLGDDGFAFFGFGAGGFLGVAAVGGELFVTGHCACSFLF